MKKTEVRPRFLTLAEAAEELRVSIHTLRHWRWKFLHGYFVEPEARSLCAAMVQIGGAIRVPVAAVESIGQLAQPGQLAEAPE